MILMILMIDTNHMKLIYIKTDDTVTDDTWTQRKHSI